MVARRRGQDDLRVFLSYRREDSSGQTGRLADSLIARIGRENVYVDVDSLAPGLDFVIQIQKHLADANVVLAIIGPDWARVTGPDGGRRLDDEGDYVRLELETALARDVPVIPVLVRGATMPPAEAFPPSIRALAHRQAVELSDAGWRRDLDAFMAVLNREYGDSGAAPRSAPPGGGHRNRRRLATAIGAPLLALALVVGLLVALRGPSYDKAEFATVGSTTDLGVLRDWAWSPGSVRETLTFHSRTSDPHDFGFREVLPPELAHLTTAVDVTWQSGGAQVGKHDGGVSVLLPVPHLQRNDVAGLTATITIKASVSESELEKLKVDTVRLMHEDDAGLQPPGRVVDLSILPESLTLHVGERAAATILITRDGSISDHNGLHVEVLDTTVARATVDEVGNYFIEGLRLGRTQLLASIGDRRVLADIEVVRGKAKPTPIGVRVAPRDLKLQADDSRQLSARVEMNSGPVPKNLDLNWSTSDPSVATVSDSGKVNALKTGTATITVTVGRLTLKDTALVIVTGSPGTAPPVIGPETSAPPSTRTTAPRANRAPTLSVTSRSYDERQRVDIQPTKGDADGDALHFSARGLPSYLHLSRTTGRITGTIPYTALTVTTSRHAIKSRALTITLIASDGHRSTPASFQVTIRDLYTVMPNYVGYYGCGGGSPGCGDPAGLPDVDDLTAHSFLCTLTDDRNKVDTVASQNVGPGTVVPWGVRVTFHYYHYRPDGC